MRSFTQATALHKLQEAIRSIKAAGTLTDEARICMSQYWQLTLIDRFFGDLPVPPRLANPPQIPPIPDDFSGLEHEVLFELVNVVGDSRLGVSPLGALLNNQEIRMDAVKEHRGRLETAMSAIDIEIERLSV